jgi:amino acid permease
MKMWKVLFEKSCKWKGIRWKKLLNNHIGFCRSSKVKSQKSKRKYYYFCFNSFRQICIAMLNEIYTWMLFSAIFQKRTSKLKYFSPKIVHNPLEKLLFLLFTCFYLFNRFLYSDLASTDRPSQPIKW